MIRHLFAAALALSPSCLAPRAFSADAEPQPPRTATAPPQAAPPNASQPSQQDSDLDRLPPSSPETSADPKPAATKGANQRIYVEDAFILSSERDGLAVPSPQLTAPSWQERLFLDLRKQWNLAEGLNFTLSDRFNFRAEPDVTFPSGENFLNEFREGYLSWEPRDRLYLDVGRINLRSGAALGFNPTDFFKTRAVIEPLSADPSVLREDRLGAFMIQGQYIGQGRTLLIAIAPPLAHTTPIYSNTNLPSINPAFGRTNDHTRLLVKGSANLGSDFSPELLFYREGNRNKVGANLTRRFGQRVIAYAEWAGGNRSNLVEEALRFGRETGTLPDNAPSPIPADPTVHFFNDLSTGASYTTSTKITFNLEYHFHQAGFSASDWRSWFDTGQGQPGSSPTARELWYIRAYALDQQEPIAKNSVFLRADWIDAFIPHFELTGFINTDMHDGSSLFQIAADYYLSNAWTVGAQVSADVGGRRSDFGSLPQSTAILFKVARYF
ncbi:MAG TPA: hypothetical protein VKX49_17495 [Bryobacteraceae bacterium]|nr:hypothetical protein [Bryobacteraceae bacterium]